MDTGLVKGWLQSKAVWAGIIGTLSGVAALFHYTISPQDTASLVDAATSIVSTIAGIAAIYGRVMATHTIVSTPLVPTAEQQAGGR